MFSCQVEKKRAGIKLFLFVGKIAYSTKNSLFNKISIAAATKIGDSNKLHFFYKFEVLFLQFFSLTLYPDFLFTNLSILGKYIRPDGEFLLLLILIFIVL